MSSSPADRTALCKRARVKLTHEQLAALAATSRETTTKILVEFAEHGFISVGRGRITVLDQDGLRSLSGR